MTELRPTPPPPPSRPLGTSASGAAPEKGSPPASSPPTHGADATDTATTGAPTIDGTAPELVPNVAPEWLPAGDPAVAPAAVGTRDDRMCEVCGNVYDKAIRVVQHGRTHVFDCFECAIHALAPTCSHCGCRIVGHGMESDGQMFCCAHCAQERGVQTMKDRADLGAP
jgi:hypothetical protein